MEQDEPLPIPTLCDACGSKRVILTTNRELHGPRAHNPDVQLYSCQKCKATAQCAPGSLFPLTVMCDSYVRTLRKHAHLEFDPIWQYGGLSRNKAYKLLAESLALSKEQCHIRVMTKEQLTATIAFCRQYLSERATIERRRQEKKDAKQLRRNERDFQLEKFKRRTKRYY